jgi:hypothetical protein
VGERLNYVIVDGDTTEVHYASWGAGTIDLDLLAGAEAARRRLRDSCRPAEVLLDPIWCEAAALVDVRRRVLMLFTWHCEDYAHRAALRAVLAETWPGWGLCWAYGGIEELATYAGQPAGANRRLDGPRSLAPAGPDDCNLLVTVAEKAGAYAMWTDVTDAFWFGPELLAALPDEARVGALPRLPASGLHLDPARRTVAGWTTLELAGLARDWPSRWPGWRWQFHEDRYETQRSRLPEPVLADGLDTLAARLTRHEAGRNADDLAVAHAAIGRVRDRAPTLGHWPAAPNGTGRST